MCSTCMNGCQNLVRAWGSGSKYPFTVVVFFWPLSLRMGVQKSLDHDHDTRSCRTNNLAVNISNTSIWVRLLPLSTAALLHWERTGKVYEKQFRTTTTNFYDGSSSKGCMCQDIVSTPSSIVVSSTTTFLTTNRRPCTSSHKSPCAISQTHQFPNVVEVPNCL